MFVIDNAVDFCELNCSDLEHLTHLYLPFNFLDRLFFSDTSKQKFFDNLIKCKNLQSLNIDNNNLDELIINEIYSLVPLLKKSRTTFNLPDGWCLPQNLSQEELIEIIDIAEYKNEHNPLINNFCEHFDDIDGNIDEDDICICNFPVAVSVINKKGYIIAEYNTNKTLSFDKKIKPAIYKSFEDSKVCLISTWLKRKINNYRVDEFVTCDEEISVAKKLRMS